MTNLSQLKEYINYDQVTGVFTWSKSRTGVAAGTIAGSGNGNGYIKVSFKGVKYYAHRLAWFYSYGKWPKELIDHIDGNRSNNTLLNLREATKRENNLNRGKRSNVLSGLKGVYPQGNRFRSKAKQQGKQVHLGYFDTPEEAHQAYKDFATENHGEFVHSSVLSNMTMA